MKQDGDRPPRPVAVAHANDRAPRQAAARPAGAGTSRKAAVQPAGDGVPRKSGPPAAGAALRRTAGGSSDEVAALLARVAQAYDQLSGRQKVVARYVEQHHARLMVERVGDVAGNAGVQPSTVVRFAQHMGFSGYSDLQAVFRRSYAAAAQPALNYQQRVRTLIQSGQRMTPGELARAFVGSARSGLDELLAEIDDAQLARAVDLLVPARDIYVIGARRSFAIASYVAYSLQHTDKKIHLVTGIGGMYHEQIRSAGERDMVIAISFTPYAKETQSCVRAAHRNGARVLVLTDSRLSPLAKHADALLLSREGSAFAFRSLTSTMCLCQAVFVSLAYRLELAVEETRPSGGYDA